MPRRSSPKWGLAQRLQFHSLPAPSGCRVWTDARYSNGYGSMAWNGRTHLAHRLAYELHVGPIPAGLQIDHLCRNRACINPMHLQPVTHAVNSLRGTGVAARGARRDHCTRGHAFVEHARITAQGHRVCLPCKRLRNSGAWRVARAALRAAEAVA